MGLRLEADAKIPINRSLCGSPLSHMAYVQQKQAQT